MRTPVAKLLPSSLPSLSSPLARGALAALVLTGCIASGGNAWVEERPLPNPKVKARDNGWMADVRAQERAGTRPTSTPGFDDAPYTPGPLARPTDDDEGAPRSIVASGDDVFRNTYYDFPAEGDGARASTIYDATCSPIANVTKDFHDRLCVQGSGRLAGGSTVSYARRDCACADVCPRTGQRICFERLDAARFPHGRGATGKPISPMRTVAVDSSIIPLGTPLFIAEFVGVARPDGSPHDGCFLAEDRGLKVVGKQIDVFTGDPSTTARVNAIVPSNRGVHVALHDARCPSGR